MYNLSEKAIAEKYEDLLFTKVMALYAAEESEKILSEIENEEPADPKNIEKIFSKTERRENFSVFWKVSKKLITVAAMVVFVAVVSFSSVVVASAEAREAVAEAIYHLMVQDYGRYTRVTIGESTGFIDPELYDWEGAYAPTYMAPGYKFSKLEKLPSQKISTYYKNDKYVSFLQSSGSVFHVDTEDVDVFKKININESDAIYVEKNGFVFIVWSIGEKSFAIRGTINPEEAIKIAEGIKPIGKTETEEYEFIDPEIYTWDNAYGMTYVPEGFKLYDVQNRASQKITNYIYEEKVITFSQAFNVISHLDTEDADITKEIQIGESKGFLVVKDDWSCVTWSIGDILLKVGGTAPTEEIIKVAESIRPMNETF